MAQTKRGATTRDASTDQPQTSDPSGEFPDVADAEAQQLAVPDEGDDVIVGEVTEMTQEAAARAAAWVRGKGYGPNMTQIIQYIAANAQDTAELNAVIMEQMAIRIINAESPEEILDPFATVKGEDLVGKSLEVRACMFLEGDKNEGFPWYTTLTVYDAHANREFPVTIGGEKLVPQVAGFDMHGAWPQVVKITEFKTRAGFTGYQLERVVTAPY